MAAKKKTEEVKSEVKEKVIATVTGGNLNVRPTHSTTGDPIRVLEDGAQVEIIEVGKEWCKIADGYVMKKYLKF